MSNNTEKRAAFRCSLKESEKIVEAAKIKGMKVSQFVRTISVIYADYVIDKDKNSNKELLKKFDNKFNVKNDKSN